MKLSDSLLRNRQTGSASFTRVPVERLAEWFLNTDACWSREESPSNGPSALSSRFLLQYQHVSWRCPRSLQCASIRRFSSFQSYCCRLEGCLARSPSRRALQNPPKQRSVRFDRSAGARFALCVRFSRINGFFAGYSIPHDLR